eukprot:1157891-Pelagomonas_calceolata.AAC.3
MQSGRSEPQSSNRKLPCFSIDSIAQTFPGHHHAILPFSPNSAFAPSEWPCTQHNGLGGDRAAIPGVPRAPGSQRSAQETGAGGHVWLLCELVRAPVSQRSAQEAGAVATGNKMSHCSQE